MLLFKTNGINQKQPIAFPAAASPTLGPMDCDNGVPVDGATEAGTIGRVVDLVLACGERKPSQKPARVRKTRYHVDAAGNKGAAAGESDGTKAARGSWAARTRASRVPTVLRTQLPAT